MTDTLQSLVRRAMSDPFFLAAPLACYAERHRLDDAALAEELGCAPVALAALRLCRNPAPAAPDFGHDVQRIARQFGLDALRLARIVRFGQGLLKLAHAAAGGDTAAGCLMAARDREAPQPP
jgi:hypothetical protein